MSTLLPCVRISANYTMSNFDFRFQKYRIIALFKNVKMTHNENITKKLPFCLYNDSTFRLSCDNFGYHETQWEIMVSNSRNNIDDGLESIHLYQPYYFHIEICSKL
jgi:hypothetical protein